jgi:hypothetical protein
MFKKMMSLVLAALGIAEFPMKDGKVDFSEEQKTLLEKEFAGQLGADFVAKFEAALNKHFMDASAQEESAEAKKLLEDMKAETQKQMKEMAEKFEAFKRESEEKIKKLGEKPEAEPAASEPTGEPTAIKSWPKPKMAYKHNVGANHFLKGADGMAVTATTIDVSELKSEFGDFMSQFSIKLEVIKKLTQKTVSEAYMTTKLAVESWRASAALISSVVQQFIAKWTPLGQAQFTPITIQNYRHKINVSIIPDEVMDSWLGYLYDEGTTPEAMPITKYIIEELIIPKVLDDRELRLIGKGVYEALNGGSIAEGDPGQATGKSMNGFCTILKNEKSSGTSAINFIDLGTITDANIVDKMNQFVDEIDELYQGIPMNIFCSNERYRQYKRAYKKLYGSESGDPKFGQDVIDYSNNRLTPLPSMAGEDLFFATPKENFIHLRYKNNGGSNIFMQEDGYGVKVFAEWWEGVGFAIGEAVFAYVPEETSGSGSGS